MTGHGQSVADGATSPATNGAVPHDHHHHHHHHPNSRINGTSVGAHSQRADVFSRSRQIHTFPDVCYKLRHRVQAFLAEDIPASNKLLHDVQKQVRVSVDVIEQALRQYR